jgi:hypothetical protein
MPSWFQNIPDKSTGNFWQNTKNEYYQWGRNTFASSFASGGYAAAAFGPTPKSRMQAALGMGEVKIGSPEHIRRLRQMSNLPGANTSKLNNTISKMEKMGTAKKSAMRSVAGGLMGVGLGAAFIGAPMISAQGGPKEKVKAGAMGAGEQVGFGVGGYFGKALGARLGGVIAPAVGSLAGGIIGGMALSGAVEGGIAFGEHLQDLGSRNRLHGWKWAQNNPAFNNQRAATMRQQAMQQMNRGMMSSRNLLGQEAQMVHQ